MLSEERLAEIEAQLAAAKNEPLTVTCPETLMLRDDDPVMIQGTYRTINRLVHDFPSVIPNLLAEVRLLLTEHEAAVKLLRSDSWMREITPSQGAWEQAVEAVEAER